MAHIRKTVLTRSAWLLLAAVGVAGVVNNGADAQPKAAARQAANDPLGTVKALYVAFEKNDMAALRRLIAPDATWSYYGPEDVLPFAGTRKGPDGVLDFFAKVEETLTDATASQREMLVSGNVVTVPGFEESTVKATGGHYKVANVHLFVVENNRIVRFEEFIDSGTVVEAFAPATPARGRAYFTTCAGCHGSSGEGNPGMHAPALAGLPSAYLLRQLRNFHAGVRGKPEDFHGYMMVGRAKALPDRAKRDVVSYIATLPAPQPAAPTPASSAAGKAAFESCAACHGTAGEGNSDVGAPPLRGMAPWYVRAQLAKFRKGLRGSDPNDSFGAQMRAALEQLPESQDGAVAAHIATLATPGGKSPPRKP